MRGRWAGTYTIRTALGADVAAVESTPSKVPTTLLILGALGALVVSVLHNEAKLS